MAYLSWLNIALLPKYCFQACLCLTVILTACSQKPAEIQYKASATSSNTSISTTPKARPLPSHPSDIPSQITVKAGDTIYSIALDYNLPIRHIIKQNQLQKPYIVKPGDSLTLPKLQQYTILSGDTLYSIARTYQISRNDIIALNQLASPYTLKSGTHIWLPSSSTPPIAQHKPSIISVQTASTTAYTPTPKTRPKHHSKTAFQLPKKTKPLGKHSFAWPVNGQVISDFGSKPGGLYNDGINIKVPAGTPVKASADGTVVYAGNALRGYGNLLIIRHHSGYLTAYAHNKTLLASRGDMVKEGQIIAKAGATGNVKSPQLHFGIRKGKKAVDPTMLLAKL